MCVYLCLIEHSHLAAFIYWICCLFTSVFIKKLFIICLYISPCFLYIYFFQIFIHWIPVFLLLFSFSNFVHAFVFHLVTLIVLFFSKERKYYLKNKNLKDLFWCYLSVFQVMVTQRLDLRRLDLFFFLLEEKPSTQKALSNQTDPVMGGSLIYKWLHNSWVGNSTPVSLNWLTGSGWKVRRFEEQKTKSRCFGSNLWDL